MEVGDKVLLPEYGGQNLTLDGCVPSPRPARCQPSRPLRHGSGLLAVACREELHLFREDDILGVLAD